MISGQTAPSAPNQTPNMGYVHQQPQPTMLSTGSRKLWRSGGGKEKHSTDCSVRWAKSFGPSLLWVDVVCTCAYLAVPEAV